MAVNNSEVTWDIIFLTNALARYQSTIARNAPPQEERRSLSKFLHIATLLTTGTPPRESNGDPYTACVVAVTGRVDREDELTYCSSLCVYPSERTSSPAVEETPEGPTQTLWPTVDLLYDGASAQNVDADQILSNWVNTT